MIYRCTHIIVCTRQVCVFDGYLPMYSQTGLDQSHRQLQLVYRWNRFDSTAWYFIFVSYFTDILCVILLYVFLYLVTESADLDS